MFHLNVMQISTNPLTDSSEHFVTPFYFRKIYIRGFSIIKWIRTFFILITDGYFTFYWYVECNVVFNPSTFFMQWLDDLFLFPSFPSFWKVTLFMLAPAAPMKSFWLIFAFVIRVDIFYCSNNFYKERLRIILLNLFSLTLCFVFYLQYYSVFHLAFCDEFLNDSFFDEF